MIDTSLYAAERIVGHLFPMFPPQVSRRTDRSMEIVVGQMPMPEVPRGGRIQIHEPRERIYGGPTWEECLRDLARGEGIDLARMNRLISKTKAAIEADRDVRFEDGE